MAIPSAIPSNQIILQTGNGQNYITWPNIGGPMWQVGRSIDGINFTAIASVIANSYLDTAVQVGVQYWYTVSPLYYIFTVSSANATAGATYTNNGVTFTVAQTIAAQTQLLAIGAFNPMASGTLTRTSGTGDATITFSSFSLASITPNSPSTPVSITPCLPGQINLGYLRYQAQLRSDLLNSFFVTTDEWNLMINQSAQELYGLLVQKFGEDYFLAPLQVFQTGGQQFYPLPNGSNFLNINGIPNPAGTPAPACFKVYGMDLNSYGAQLSNATGWVSMSRFNIADRNKYNLMLGAASNNVAGQYAQFQYREMGTNVEVLPINSGQYLRLWYVPISPQMLLDTDMLPFSYSGWHEYVVVDAAAKALSKQQFTDQAQDLMGKKMALLERIESEAANRDVGQPNTSTNTRSMLGDPNFGGGMYGNGSGGWGGGGGYGY
jgi:hypothetical protein